MKVRSLDGCSNSFLLFFEALCLDDRVGKGEGGEVE